MITFCLLTVAFFAFRAMCHRPITAQEEILNRFDEATFRAFFGREGEIRTRIYRATIYRLNHLDHSLVGEHVTALPLKYEGF